MKAVQACKIPPEHFEKAGFSRRLPDVLQHQRRAVHGQHLRHGNGACLGQGSQAFSLAREQVGRRGGTFHKNRAAVGKGRNT